MKAGPLDLVVILLALFILVTVAIVVIGNIAG
jgi:hypothetical protein